MYKPVCKLVGENGNIFNLLGVAKRVLESNGKGLQGKEMQERILKSDSYSEALRIIMEYVDVE